jgi:hypothetical protein
MPTEAKHHLHGLLGNNGQHGFHRTFLLGRPIDEVPGTLYNGFATTGALLCIGKPVGPARFDGFPYLVIIPNEARFSRANFVFEPIFPVSRFRQATFVAQPLSLQDVAANGC